MGRGGDREDWAVEKGKGWGEMACNWRMSCSSSERIK